MPEVARMRVQFLIASISVAAVVLLFILVARLYQVQPKQVHPKPSSTSPDSTETLQRFEFTQVRMGMPVTLTVWASRRSKAEVACKHAFDRIKQLNQIFSDYDIRSETSQINRLRVGKTLACSPEFATLWQHARELHEVSNGSFDPTAGLLIRLWRDARKSGIAPSPRDLQAALRQRGFDSLRVELIETRPSGNGSNDTESDRAQENIKRTIVTRLTPSALDFGSIAKGFIGDQALVVLAEHGIDSACFEAGGDIVLSDPPPDAAGWQIDVPRLGSLTIANAAVSISGDTVQFVNTGDRRYSHVIDMKTGLGVTDRRMAIVIAKHGYLSDALATIGCTLPESSFQDLLEQVQVARGWSFIYDESDE